MNAKWIPAALLTVAFTVGCASRERIDDRALIESIADDIEAAVGSGDLLKIERHLSSQAKQRGYEANRFLMECSYGAEVPPELTARTIKVMGDSAHLAFALMPTGMPYSDSLSRSVVRLMRIDTWKIASFHLAKNVQEVVEDSVSQ
jgi:hypothetical protein